MELDIKIWSEQTGINPNQLQRVRRTINVLNEIGFDVNLSFVNGEGHNNKDEYGTPFAGGRYPHVGNFIRMQKDTNSRLDRPVKG